MREMIDELNGADSGQRNSIVKRYSKMTGKSIQALYRIAGQNGYVSGRNRRRDRRGSGINKGQIMYVASLMHTSSREVKGPIMDVETALSIAEDNNIIEPGSVSVSWMQSLLREYEISREALNTPRPSTRMRSLHPNHVHVFHLVHYKPRMLRILSLHHHLSQ